jgi:hypothetical protein
VNPRFLFMVSKIILLSIVLNLAFHARALSSECDSPLELDQRVPKALVAFLIEDEEDESDKVIGTGFVINKFGDIAAPKHVLIDKGKTKRDAKVQLFAQKSVKLEEQYKVLFHSLGTSERDWLILKKRYPRKPEFDNLESGYGFLNISHNRYIDQVPTNGTVWYVESVRSHRIIIKRAAGSWVGPNADKPGKFQVTMERFGGDSGAVYIDNCTGEVHGILETAKSDGSVFFDHTGALMELALDQVVDFDTSQGIFRGESDRRTDRINVAFRAALQAQLDSTDRELNLLKWTAKVRDWNLVGDRGKSKFALNIGIEYKRIPRPGSEDQHLPIDNRLYNAWVCVVLDNEIAIEKCLRGTSQRLTSTNSFEPPDHIDGDYEAFAPLTISINEFRSKMSDLVDEYPARKNDLVEEDDTGRENIYRVDNVKGILVRFEPTFDTFNILRYYDPKTGYKKTSGGELGIFSVVYEACIPTAKKHDRVEAKVIGTSHESDDFVSVMEKDTRSDTTSCIFEKWDGNLPER